MENTEALVVVSKEVVLEVDAEKTKYMFMSRDQHVGQSDNINTGYNFFETVEHFTHLGTALTNQNCTHEEVERRVKFENACYHSMQNLLSSSLLSKNIEIKMYRNGVFPVASYVCET
jgi:hypothetical protein